MAQGLGIAAIIIAVLSYFVPVVGIAGTGIAMLLATVAALAGDKGLTIATVVLGAVNTFLFSPAVWVWIAADDTIAFVTVIVVVLALPLVGMFLHSSGKFTLGQPT